MKLNTTQPSNPPYLDPDEKWVFALEGMELAFERWRLRQIIQEWNRGLELEVIARKHMRHPLEIFLALVDQARYKRVTRPFAYRKE